MSTFKKLLAMVFAVALIFAFTACEKEGPMEKAGEKVDQAVEEVGEKAEEAGDAIKEKTE